MNFRLQTLDYLLKLSRKVLRSLFVVLAGFLTDVVGLTTVVGVGVGGTTTGVGVTVGEVIPVDIFVHEVFVQVVGVGKVSSRSSTSVRSNSSSENSCKIHVFSSIVPVASKIVHVAEISTSPVREK